MRERRVALEDGLLGATPTYKQLESEHGVGRTMDSWDAAGTRPPRVEALLHGQAAAARLAVGLLDGDQPLAESRRYLLWPQFHRRLTLLALAVPKPGPRRSSTARCERPFSALL
jgi:hypothetical protein